jgi:hypothetical protein
MREFSMVLSLIFIVIGVVGVIHVIGNIKRG